MKADFYETLSVSRNADEKELKSAFRKRPAPEPLWCAALTDPYIPSGPEDPFPLAWPEE